VVGWRQCKGAQGPPPRAFLLLVITGHLQAACGLECPHITAKKRNKPDHIHKCQSKHGLKATCCSWVKWRFDPRDRQTAKRSYRLQRGNRGNPVAITEAGEEQVSPKVQSSWTKQFVIL